MTWRWAKNQWERKKKKKGNITEVLLRPPFLFFWFLSLQLLTSLLAARVVQITHSDHVMQHTHTHTKDFCVCVMSSPPFLLPCVCVCHLKKKKNHLSTMISSLSAAPPPKTSYTNNNFIPPCFVFLFIIFFSLTFPPSAFIPQQQKYPREKNWRGHYAELNVFSR